MINKRLINLQVGVGVVVMANIVFNIMLDEQNCRNCIWQTKLLVNNLKLTQWMFEIYTKVNNQEVYMHAYKESMWDPTCYIHMFYFATQPQKT